jgi:predicted TIM-barrel fold metal-dependent hydrolase
MIFDCHTHLARDGDIGGDFLADARRAWGTDYQMACSAEDHRKEMEQCDGAIVLALDAAEAGFYVSNEYVAEYVAADPGRLFGFASVNPNRPSPERLLEGAKGEYKLVGLKLAPVYQFFDPLDKKCYPLYSKAQELDMPILWHQGTSYIRMGPLELCNPVLLDPVARAFPNLKMVIAHLGHPWYAEAVSVVRKHPNVYADVSALCTRPWQMYNAILCAVEYNVGDKLLFGTDFPFSDCNQTVQALRNINTLTEGTALPRIPETLIEAIIHRNTPEILGIV